MIIDLKSLRGSGKTEEDFFFEYIPQEELSTIPSASIELPIKICGKVILTGEHSALVEGEIAFSIKGECTRCLKETLKDYMVSFEQEFSEENEEGYVVVNDKIDLSKITEDETVLNMPVSFLCKEDCKGICTGCGVNLNDGDCKCTK